MMPWNRLLTLPLTVMLLTSTRVEAQPPVKATLANPKANFVMAVDVSHTMWHGSGVAGPVGSQRFHHIRGMAQPEGALELFKYDFNYGFFAYTAARTFKAGYWPGFVGGGDNAERHAQIVDDIGSHAMVWPNTAAGAAALTNPDVIGKYDTIRLRVANTYVYNNCVSAKGVNNCEEHTTRGGSPGFPSLTPNGIPLAEKNALQQVLDYYSDAANQPGAGMFLPPLQPDGAGGTYSSTPCEAGHALAPAPGYDPNVASAMCGTVPCFDGWHRPYIDQLVMNGTQLDRYDFYFELFHELGYWAWPRYWGAPTGADVDADFCQRLATPLANMKDRLNACLNPVKSDRYWSGAGFDCDPAQLSATICNNSGPNGGSPFFTGNTCVCFPNQAGCGGLSLPDDCTVNDGVTSLVAEMNATPANGENPVPGGVFAGSFLSRPYRQAEAMCYSERPQVGVSYQSSATQAEPQFRTQFRDQPGNVLTAGDKCRANVVAFFTDGHGGNGGGVAAHAPMNRWVYKSRNRDGTYYPENHVFHATGRGVGYDTTYVAAADQMSNTLSAGVRGNAHNLTNQKLTAAAFAGIFNRTQAGQYSSAPMVTDRFGTRIGVISYEVPGRYSDADFSRYLGRPGRLSWYELNDDGSLGALLWETDWKSRTDAWQGGALSGAYQSRFFWGGAGTVDGFTATDGSALNVAMDAQWSATHANVGNGWTRFRNIGAVAIDRNGDGVLDAADNPPAGSGGFVWGGMIGVENAKPVIVEAPIDPPGFGSSDFYNFATAANIGDRPRVVYVQANEFLHAIHAGDRIAGGGITTAITGSINLTQNREFSYNDSSALSGTELWRYRPGFLRETPRVDLASAMHYPLMNGSLVARDIKYRPADASPLTKYATVLAMTQGATGRGLAVLNISQPANAGVLTQAQFNPAGALKRVIFDNVLPAADVASTTADPQIVEWPGTGANANRVALVMTSGWASPADAPGAPKKILVYQLTNGAGNDLQSGSTNTLTQIALPLAGGATLPSGARCVDFGKDFACYALDSTGVLWRATVNVGTGAFTGTIVNMNGFAGGGGSVDTSRVYNSLPAFYFGSDNALNIVFGSGNPDTLRQTEAGDRIYRFRDASLSGGTAAYLTTQVCDAATSGSDSGIIDLPPGERLLTNPVVASGVVSWTTYVPPAAANVCGVGMSRVYAMDFQKCTDAINVANNRPQGQDLAEGVPSSPTVIPRTGQVVAHSSKQVTAAQINGVAKTVETRGFLRKPIQRVYRLWWRRKAL